MLGAVSLPGALSSRRVGAVPHPLYPRMRGCCLIGEGASFIHQLKLFGGISSSQSVFLDSGNRRLDRAIGILLADLANRFRVRPGFAFYDDGSSPNAIATPFSHFRATEGTVLFGRKLLARHLSKPFGDLFIAAVCAHEFAHISQFSSGYFRRLSASYPTAKLVELHADFLSGFYIGSRNVSYSAQELVALGRAIEEIGDSNFTALDHHGTASERLRSIERGYLIGSKTPNLGLFAACELGTEFLLQHLH